MTERNPSSNDTVATETGSDETWRLQIPPHLGAKIEQRISETKFDSADEYVTFVLESLLREVDEQDDNVVIDVRGAEPDGSEKVQDRLESLGYL